MSTHLGFDGRQHEGPLPPCARCADLRAEMLGALAAEVRLTPEESARWHSDDVAIWAPFRREARERIRLKAQESGEVIELFDAAGELVGVCGPGDRPDVDTGGGCAGPHCSGCSTCEPDA